MNNLVYSLIRIENALHDKVKSRIITLTDKEIKAIKEKAKTHNYGL